MARFVPRRWATLVLSVAAALVYCWYAAELRPFTVPMDAAVAFPAAVIAVLAGRGPAPLRRPTRPKEAWPWAALFGLLVLVELTAYLSSSRAAHPTLSSMADALMGTHIGRSATMVAWLAVGVDLFAVRRRRPT